MFLRALFIITTSPSPLPAAVTCHPAPSSLSSSLPLTVRPVLLGAALLGEGRRRRCCCCCCSVTLMPVVTDLEYNTSAMGHPQYSQHILVVRVTPQCRPSTNTDAVSVQDSSFTGEGISTEPCHVFRCEWKNKTQQKHFTKQCYFVQLSKAVSDT